MSGSASNVDFPSLAGLQKATVASLKALCKNGKITGYSKLSKPALIEKLVASGYLDGDPTTLPASSQTLVLDQNSNHPALDNAHIALKYASAAVANQSTESMKERPQSKKAKSRQPKAKEALAETGLLTEPFHAPTQNADGETTSGDGKSYISSTADAPTHPQRGSTTQSSLAVLLPHAPVPKSGECFSARHDPTILVRNDSSAATKPPTPSASSISHTASKRPRQTPIMPLKKQKVTHIPATAQGILSFDKQLVSETPTLQTSTLATSQEPTQSAMSGHELTAPTACPQATLLEPVADALSSTKPLRPTVPTANRFKPLLIKKPHDSSSSRAQCLATSADISSSKAQCSSHTEHPQARCHLDFPPAAHPPDLFPITLPPSLSQRKRVHRWAVILSGISDRERRQCVLVSRMFRYAVYLSASQILNQKYDGDRLKDDVATRYSQAMTNMWPYLRMRQEEASQRRRVFEESFVGRFLMAKGLFKPIADHLWASPDNERQIAIAVKFIVSSLWFTISIGSYACKKDRLNWLAGTVIDTHEVVKGELWSVTVSLRSSGAATPQQHTFYVLEPTCEVVGRPPVPPSGKQDHSFPTSPLVRADWSRYMQERVASSDPVVSLLNHVKWMNHEEYFRGVSKLWLSRTSNEGKLGAAKHIVAERYVLACVVGNSVSGQWMSASEMAQDFAGLPSRMAPVPTRLKAQAVNLFLPEHHYVESVHFLTSKGEYLHPAVAVVQTPHREYYILRDNGMQVGCEEDGVAVVWQDIIGCDHKGL